MPTRITKTSPRFLARMAGVLFLLTILAGIFAQAFVSERLIVFNDAALTANNILSHKGLLQAGYAVYLFEMACQIAMAAFFYLLLRPVSNSIALAATFLELSGCIIKTFARVFFIMPLFVLGGAPSLSMFSTEEQQGLALLLLKVNDQGAVLALAFFGFSTTLTGYLTFRSGFLPRWLGVLSFVSGLGWLTFLYPPLGQRAFPFVVIVALLGSVATIFWLLVFGVDEERWREQAGAGS